MVGHNSGLSSPGPRVLREDVMFPVYLNLYLSWRCTRRLLIQRGEMLQSRKPTALTFVFFHHSLGYRVLSADSQHPKQIIFMGHLCVLGENSQVMKERGASWFGVFSLFPLPTLFTLVGEPSFGAKAVSDFSFLWLHNSMEAG